MKTTIVASLDLPGLEPYRTLRRPLEHHRRGILVAEGEKVVRRLLESNLRVHSALMTREWLAVYSPLLENHDIDVFVADKRLVESIVGFPLHQGIMAVAQVPQNRSIDQMLQNLRKPLFLAAIEGLTNAENIGVLVRNCAAFGVQALIVGETSSSPYLRRAVRNSMGAVFQLPIAHVTNLGDTLSDLRGRFDTHIIAAHPGGSSELGSTNNLEGSCCIIFGSEGDGISEEILERCDAALSIRMESGVDSLNVGSASAVFLYEVRRRRK